MHINIKELDLDYLLPPAAIPQTAPRASKRPTTRSGAFGMESISSVTMPARYRKCKMEKYTATYLKNVHTNVILAG